MKRILWIGDGVTPTGFSTVNHNIIKNLPRDKYEVHHLAVNFWGDPHNYDHYIYPASTPQLFTQGDLLGYGRIGEFKDLGIDLIFILNDIWVIDRYLEVIKQIWSPKEMPKIVVYYPVDGGGYSPAWYRHFDIVTKTVVYTNFGKEVTQKAVPHIEPHVIPHGAADKNVFHILDEQEWSKAEAYPQRPDLWEDSFIVLNANRNQPRKRLDISALGFALFAKDKPKNVMYYHHAGIKDVGWNIVEFIQRLEKEFGYDLQGRTILTNAEVSNQQVSTDLLNRIYNTTDVGLNTSLGEGWGLIQTEQAYLGKPQITGNHTACAELFYDVGLLLPVKHIVHDTATLLERYFVCAEDVAECLERLYQDKELYNKLSEESKSKFSQPYYDWIEIGKMWTNLFSEILGEEE